MKPETSEKDLHYVLCWCLHPALERLEFASKSDANFKKALTSFYTGKDVTGE